MSANLKDLIDGEADLDDEEDDESFDEETGETRHRPSNGQIDDSSEEEEDDEDEEEARRVGHLHNSMRSVLRDADVPARHRSAKDSSSTKMRKMRPRTRTQGDAEEKSAVANSARRKSSWTRKISTSLERPTPSGSAKRAR